MDKKRIEEIKEVLIDEFKIRIISFIKENKITNSNEFKTIKDSPSLIFSLLGKVEPILDELTELYSEKDQNEIDSLIPNLIWNSSILAMNELGFDLKETFNDALSNEGAKEWINKNALSEVKEIIGLNY